MSVIKLVNRVPYKFIDYANIKSGASMNIHEFIKMSENLKAIPDSAIDRKKRLVSEQSMKSHEPCSGDLCNAILKN